MKYFLINVKKIYKNKLNSIPVFIIILFLAFLYVGNLKSATIEFDLDSPVSIKEDINSTSEQIGLFENNLKSISLDSEECINFLSTDICFFLKLFYVRINVILYINSIKIIWSSNLHYIFWH